MTPGLASKSKGVTQQRGNNQRPPDAPATQPPAPLGWGPKAKAVGPVALGVRPLASPASLMKESEINHLFVSQIEKMGFSRARAVEALQLHQNDLENAINYLLDSPAPVEDYSSAGSTTHSAKAIGVPTKAVSLASRAKAPVGVLPTPKKSTPPTTSPVSGPGAILTPASVESSKVAAILSMSSAPQSSSPVSSSVGQNIAMPTATSLTTSPALPKANRVMGNVSHIMQLGSNHPQQQQQQMRQGAPLGLLPQVQVPHMLAQLKPLPGVAAAQPSVGLLTPPIIPYWFGGIAAPSLGTKERLSSFKKGDVVPDSQPLHEVIVRWDPIDTMFDLESSDDEEQHDKNKHTIQQDLQQQQLHGGNGNNNGNNGKDVSDQDDDSGLLSLEAGDLVLLEDRSSSSWAYGRIVDRNTRMLTDRSGWFPLAIVFLPPADKTAEVTSKRTPLRACVGRLGLPRQQPLPISIAASVGGDIIDVSRNLAMPQPASLGYPVGFNRSNPLIPPRPQTGPQTISAVLPALTAQRPGPVPGPSPGVVVQPGGGMHSSNVYGRLPGAPGTLPPGSNVYTGAHNMMANRTGIPVGLTTVLQTKQPLAAKQLVQQQRLIQQQPPGFSPSNQQQSIGFSRVALPTPSVVSSAKATAPGTR